jgi:hypothetical protein
MARPYSGMFLRDLHRSVEPTLGQNLALVCVKARIPANYAALALETSRITVYGWFRGKGIRKKKHKTVETFIHLLEEDLLAGRLPAANTADAKAYIQDMLGICL